MARKISNWLGLAAILLFASFIYFYRLSDIPNGTYFDEATVGYNAYSILKTGADEYGQKYPVAFRFFGAYTPPLFVYLSVPLIHFFGLNPFSLRFLSVISTLIGIIAIHFFTSKLSLFQSKMAPILASIIFAISPWVVFNARLGYEVTLGYVLFLCGVCLVWWGMTENKISYLGLLILSVSTYVAHTERFLVPIFLVFFIFVFWKRIKPLISRQVLFRSLILFLATQWPHLLIINTSAFWVKNAVYRDVPFINLVADFISQYLSYLSPSEIFGTSKDINLQHTIPELGQFYSWMIIPYFIGLYALYKQSKVSDSKLIWLLLLVSPLPGALSGHFLSIQRVLPLIIPIVLIITLGLDAILAQLKPCLFLLLLTFFIPLSLMLLIRSYFIFLPQERAIWWSNGYKEAAHIISSHPDTQYLFDNSRLPAAYMSFLFHLQHPPSIFQNNFSQEFRDNYYSNPPYNPNYRIANLTIRPIVWESDPLIPQVLIGDQLSISTGQANEHFLVKVIQIDDPFGNVIFVGYQTNPEKKIADNINKANSKIRQRSR